MPRRLEALHLDSTGVTPNAQLLIPATDIHGTFQSMPSLCLVCYYITKLVTVHSTHYRPASGCIFIQASNKPVKPKCVSGMITSQLHVSLLTLTDQN